MGGIAGVAVRPEFRGRQVATREIYQTGPNFVWMTRLVDAPGAIEARGYDDQVAAEVHLAIDDELAPWNAGNFVLRVDGGKGGLEPGGSGKVALSAGSLASLYTGWSSPYSLHSWGLLDGADLGDMAALRRSFGGSTTPWMRDFF